MGSLDPGGWPGLMAANRAMAIEARENLQAALGVEPIAPDELIGSMAAVRLPTLTSDTEAAALNDALSEEIGSRFRSPAGPSAARVRR